MFFTLYLKTTFKFLLVKIKLFLIKRIIMFKKKFVFTHPNFETVFISRAYTEEELLGSDILGIKAETYSEKEILKEINSEPTENLLQKIFNNYKVTETLYGTCSFDKNNEEIFTGDFIQYDNDESMSHWVAGEIALCVFKPSRFLLQMRPFNKIQVSNVNVLKNEDVADCGSIIGNKYTHKELYLKGCE